MKRVSPAVKLFALVISLAVHGCAAGTGLAVRGTDFTEVKGSFTLILYGCHYANDIENLALLVPDSGPYAFSMYARETAYRVKRGVSGQEAVSEAERFLRCSFPFKESRLSRIMDSDGSIVAYEVRPLYSPFDFGRFDVLDVRYSLKGGIVTVYIMLYPDVERIRSDFGPADVRDGQP